MRPRKGGKVVANSPEPATTSTTTVPSNIADESGPRQSERLKGKRKGQEMEVEGTKKQRLAEELSRAEEEEAQKQQEETKRNFEKQQGKMERNFQKQQKALEQQEALRQEDESECTDDEKEEDEQDDDSEEDKKPGSRLASATSTTVNPSCLPSFARWLVEPQHECQWKKDTGCEERFATRMKLIAHMREKHDPKKPLKVS